MFLVRPRHIRPERATANHVGKQVRSWPAHLGRKSGGPLQFQSIYVIPLMVLLESILICSLILIAPTDTMINMYRPPRLAFGTRDVTLEAVHIFWRDQGPLRLTNSAI